MRMPMHHLPTPFRRASWISLAFAGVLVSSPSLRAQIPSGKRPQYGAWGIDLAGADTSTRPGADFFRYANGRWLDRTAIPADKSAYTLRVAMSDLIDQRLHALLDSAAARAGHSPTTVEGKVGAFYRSYLDSTRVERLGVSPVSPLLAAVRRARTRSQIAELMGRGAMDLYGSVFSVATDVDRKDPSVYSVYVGQSGLLLPERDYYLKPEFESQRAALRQHAATVLRLVGWPDAARAAD
jgi:putative endopeptidase